MLQSLSYLTVLYLWTHLCIYFSDFLLLYFDHLDFIPVSSYSFSKVIKLKEENKPWRPMLAFPEDRPMGTSQPLLCPSYDGDMLSRDAARDH